MKKKDLTLDSIVLMTISLLAGAFGYLYQILIGKIVSVEEYGEINVVLVYVSMATMLVFPLCYISSKKITTFLISGDENRILQYYHLLYVIMSVATIAVIAVGGVLFFLNSSSLYYMSCCLAVIIINMIYSVLLYLVQGHKKYILFGVISLVLSILKLVLLGIVAIGKVTINYILLSQLLAYFVCVYVLWNCLLRNKQTIKVINREDWFDIKKGYGVFLIYQLLNAFVCNGGELIVFKKIYTEYEVGIIAVVLTLCKVSYFMVTPLSTILFTEVVSANGDCYYQRKVLYRTILISITVAVLYSIFLTLFGDEVVGILFGNKYGEVSSFAGTASIFVIGVIIFGIISQYFAAKGEFRYIICPMILCIVVLLVILLIHIPINNVFALIGWAYITIGGITLILDKYKGIAN